MALFKQMIGRGTRLFPDEDKPGFDGPPERVDEEEIDAASNVVEDLVVEHNEPAFGHGNDDTLDPDDLKSEPRTTFCVDDIPVWVTAEAVHHLVPEIGASTRRSWLSGPT